LSVLLLLLALRTCWDRLPESAAPWFARDQGVSLSDGASTWAARLRAVGEEGAELRLESDAAPPGPGAILELVGLIPDGARLALRVERLDPATGSGVRLGGRWQGLEGESREALQRELYRRSGLWPTCQAPFEPRALLAAVLRLVSSLGGGGWFRRSLLPQNH
jgi:hypothetical protein